MSQTVEYKEIVNEKLETAINIGCTMVSRSQKVRKKLDSSSADNTSVRKSLKKLHKMSIELIDKLFEINAQIDFQVKEESQTLTRSSKISSWLNRIWNSSRKKIENMKITYQDIYTL